MSTETDNTMMIPKQEETSKRNHQTIARIEDDKACSIILINAGVHGRGIGRGGRVRREYMSETRVNLDLRDLGRWISKDLC
jgi:hypothetical protein